MTGSLMQICLFGSKSLNELGNGNQYHILPLQESNILTPGICSQTVHEYPPPPITGMGQGATRGEMECQVGNEATRCNSTPFRRDKFPLEENIFYIKTSSAILLSKMTTNM